ncbi:GRIP domain-containing protein RUD3-like [Pyrus ussuriensis x Pyrus communis]|uniref:GRIP domain-containing protein RUD3-like n=1 Tax=Pyrus ussuriensis x Pyrus communis TaxID=2448454 RepID=A0A5N5FAX4_9ROSA|nr:GRIP domain-containing protein RUD3-like [Pyrus ussuriensis x Pyrus communis]
MSGPSNHHLDLNVVEEVAMSPQDNIWCPSFLSSTGSLTIGDSVMKNDITAAVVAKNLLTPKDNRLLSKQSDELAIKDSLALNVQCAVTRGNIKLFERELADVEKMLRVPKEDKHLGKLRPLFGKYGFQPLVSECQRRAIEKVSKKGGTRTKKGKTPMLVPVDDILFHKGARKHRVRPTPRSKSQEEVLKITASKKAEAEAIRYVNNCLAGRRSMVDELGEPLDENESDHDWIMRRFSYYDDKLREVERYKAKFKENNQLMNDARKMSKALAEAIRLKDQHFESLKRRNGELDSALVEVSELKRSIPTKFLGSQAFHNRPHCIRAANFEKMKWMAYSDEMDECRQRSETFILAVDPSSEDDFDNEAIVVMDSKRCLLKLNWDNGLHTKVVNCNDRIADLALPCRHWADKIKSPLGEGPRADHRSKRLRRGVMNSYIGSRSNMISDDSFMYFSKDNFRYRRAYSIATLSRVVRTSPAPQPCWLDEPSTYRVHTGSVGSTFRASGGDEATASGDVKLSQCYRPFDHLPRSVRTLKYLSKGAIGKHDDGVCLEVGAKFPSRHD